MLHIELIWLSAVDGYLKRLHTWIRRGLAFRSEDTIHFNILYNRRSEEELYTIALATNIWNKLEPADVRNSLYGQGYFSIFPRDHTLYLLTNFEYCFKAILLEHQILSWEGILFFELELSL